MFQVKFWYIQDSLLKVLPQENLLVYCQLCPPICFLFLVFSHLFASCLRFCFCRIGQRLTKWLQLPGFENPISESATVCVSALSALFFSNRTFAQHGSIFSFSLGPDFVKYDTKFFMAFKPQAWEILLEIQDD